MWRPEGLDKARVLSCASSSTCSARVSRELHARIPRDQQREPDRRVISRFVTIAGCGQPVFNRYRRKNLFRENLPSPSSSSNVHTIRPSSSFHLVGSKRILPSRDAATSFDSVVVWRQTVNFPGSRNAKRGNEVEFPIVAPEVPVLLRYAAPSLFGHDLPPPVMVSSSFFHPFVLLGLPTISIGAHCRPPKLRSAQLPAKRFDIPRR